MAEEYYESFRPAIELYGPGPEPSRASEEASDRGLVRLDEMAQAGADLDELGERRSAESLGEVERATRTARWYCLQ